MGTENNTENNDQTAKDKDGKSGSMPWITILSTAALGIGTLLTGGVLPGIIAAIVGLLGGTFAQQAYDKNAAANVGNKDTAPSLQNTQQAIANNPNVQQAQQNANSFMQGSTIQPGGALDPNDPRKGVEVKSNAGPTAAIAGGAVLTTEAVTQLASRLAGRPLSPIRGTARSVDWAANRMTGGKVRTLPVFMRSSKTKVADALKAYEDYQSRKALNSNEVPTDYEYSLFKAALKDKKAREVLTGDPLSPSVHLDAAREMDRLVKSRPGFFERVKSRLSRKGSNASTSVDPLDPFDYDTTRSMIESHVGDATKAAHITDTLQYFSEQAPDSVEYKFYESYMRGNNSAVEIIKTTAAAYDPNNTNLGLSYLNDKILEANAALPQAQQISGARKFGRRVGAMGRKVGEVKDGVVDTAVDIHKYTVRTAANELSDIVSKAMAGETLTPKQVMTLKVLGRIEAVRTQFEASNVAGRLDFMDELIVANTRPGGTFNNLVDDVKTAAGNAKASFDAHYGAAYDNVKTGFESFRNDFKQAMNELSSRMNPVPKESADRALKAYEIIEEFRKNPTVDLAADQISSVREALQDPQAAKIFNRAEAIRQSHGSGRNYVAEMTNIVDAHEVKGILKRVVEDNLHGSKLTAEEVSTLKSAVKKGYLPPSVVELASDVIFEHTQANPTGFARVRQGWQQKWNRSTNGTSQTSTGSTQQPVTEAPPATGTETGTGQPKLHVEVGGNPNGNPVGSQPPLQVVNGGNGNNPVPPSGPSGGAAGPAPQTNGALALAAVDPVPVAQPEPATQLRVVNGGAPLPSGISGGTNMAFGGIGLYNGVNAYQNADKAGDNIGKTVAGAEVVNGVALTTYGGAELLANTSKLAPLASTTSKLSPFMSKLGPLGIMLDAADGANQLRNAKTNDERALIGVNKAWSIGSGTAILSASGTGIAAIDTTLAAGGTLAAGEIAIAAALPLAVVGATIAAGCIINEDAKVVVETNKTYRELDAQYHPDKLQHGNFISATAQILGDKQMAAELTKLGVETEPNGRISSKSLYKALTDPTIGDSVTSKIKEFIGKKKEAANQDIKSTNILGVIPRDDFVQAISRINPVTALVSLFGGARVVDGFEGRDKLEAAKLDVRSLDSALTEIDSFKQAYAQKQAAIQAAHNSVNSGKLDTFKSLPPGVQDIINLKLERDYASYMQKNGTAALKHDDYMNAGRIEATDLTGPKGTENLTLLRKYVALDSQIISTLAIEQVAQWKSQNPGGDENAALPLLMQQLRSESVTDNQKFQARIADYQQRHPEGFQLLQQAAKVSGGEQAATNVMPSTPMGPNTNNAGNTL